MIRAILSIAFFTVLCLTNNTYAADPKLNKELLFAVQTMDVPKVKELLAKGADANFKDTNRSLLGWASQGGSVEIVQALIAAKADLNSIDGVGHTPLMRAVETQQVEIVNALLKAKPNLTITSKEGKTIVMMAVDSRKPEIVKALLAAGADPSAVDGDGDSPALVAAQSGGPESVEIIKILGQAKANLNLSNIVYTALVYAVQQNNKEVVKALLDAGADPNAKTRSGQFPLSEALSSPEIVTMLLQAKANPNIVNSSGEPVLFAAIEQGTPEIVQSLVKAGADINLKNQSGSSAVEFANMLSKPDIAEMLKTGVNK